MLLHTWTLINLSSPSSPQFRGLHLILHQRHHQALRDVCHLLETRKPTVIKATKFTEG